MLKKIIFILITLTILSIFSYLVARTIRTSQLPTTENTLQTTQTIPTPTSNSTTPQTEEPTKLLRETIAENLTVPWDLAFLPNEDILVTERPGSLLKITQGSPQLIQEIPGVQHIGEGGLLGLALHPNFSQNNWLYLYLTTQTDSGLINRVQRYTFINNQITDPVTILDNIPGARYHDGGRIAFGPDGYLYIATGDASDTNLAQETSSLAGKILRVSDQGETPPDNPFNNLVYSLGHRNPQGLAWDDQGQLWSTEHGPSGVSTGFDELNLIQIGGNYGWPEIRGNQIRQDMQAAVIQSGSDQTWAPASALYFNNSIFFGGLRGEGLYQAKLVDNKVTQIIRHFANEYGRIRTATLGPDGDFYITTSNTDGRGSPKEADDKIIRIDPSIF